MTVNTQNQQFVNKFFDEFFSKKDGVLGTDIPDSDNQSQIEVAPVVTQQQQFFNFGWIFKKKPIITNCETMVNIDKDAKQTKINMEYVDIKETFE